MAHLFISYASEDQNWAEWIAWELERAGYRTTIQAWDFHPGKNFVLEMHDALAHADHIVAVLSKNYLSAHFTHSEWAAGFAQDPSGIRSKLIPVRVDDCTPAGLLGQIVYIDLNGYLESKAQQRLREGVRRAIDTDSRGKPEDRPPYAGYIEKLDEAADVAEARSHGKPRNEEHQTLTDLQRSLRSEVAVRLPAGPERNVPREFPGLNPTPELASMMDKDTGDRFLSSELQGYVDEMQSKRRKLEPLKLCLSLIDIDDLTVISRKFGAGAGSLVLMEVMRIIVKNGPKHRCGRCGDDTFFVFLHGFTGDQAVKYIERLLGSIQKHDWSRIALDLRVAASAGVTSLHPYEPSIEFVIRAANGMKLAKDRGGNNVQIGPSTLPLEVPSYNLRSYYS